MSQLKQQEQTVMLLALKDIDTKEAASIWKCGTQDVFKIKLKITPHRAAFSSKALASGFKLQ